MRSQLRIAYRPVYRAKTRQHRSARATNRLVARLRPGRAFGVARPTRPACFAPWSAESSNWKERVQRFRIQEWLLHEEMLQVATETVRQFQKHPRRASLNDLVNIFNLPSVLGRRACGIPLVAAAAAEFEPPASNPDFEAALRKIYGANDACKPAVSPEEVP
jgi:hypothetical protein